MPLLQEPFLSGKEVRLMLRAVREGDPERGLVPAYYFYICDNKGKIVGQCDLRVGFNALTFYGGNIGYIVDAPYRGHRYSEKAARLLFRFARKLGMETVYITCNPENTPSKKICESLGGKFLGVFEIPKNHPLRTKAGETRKNVYKYYLTGPTLKEA